MPQDFLPLLELVLKDLVREKREITVYLMNGFQIKGVLKNWDFILRLYQKPGCKTARFL